MSTNEQHFSATMDFRDIHEHPPVAEPITTDPSWDIGRVYFNEFENHNPSKNNNNTSDNLFDTTLWDVVDDNNEEEEKKEKDQEVTPPPAIVEPEDVQLDPLGWPVQQEDFFNVKSNSDPFSGIDDANKTQEEEPDNDDENLLPGRSSDEYYRSSSEKTGALCDMTGVLEALNVCGGGGAKSSSGDETTTLSKEQRIQMYVTQGVDEDSSVEEDDHGDSDEEDIGYVVQDEDGDDEMHAADEEKDLPEFTQVVVQDAPTLDIAALAATEAVDPAKDSGDSNSPAGTSPAKLDFSSKPKKKKSFGGIVPLIKPPPEEKLKKWANDQARKVQHIESIKKKKEEEKDAL